MNIMAVDQARKGAWSIFDYETKQLLKYGTFSFNNKKYTYAQAVMNIEKIIAETIEKYNVGAVFIEDIQLRVNPQSFKRLAQLQGVLINLFEKNDYLYGLVHPKQWQEYCRARGRNSTEINKKVIELKANGKKDSKILSIQFIKEQFDIDTTNDNLADACCIGYYVVNNINIENTREEA